MISGGGSPPWNSGAVDVRIPRVSYFLRPQYFLPRGR